MINDAAATYGDRHAEVYDLIYGARFAPDAAVDTLAAASGGGAVLELGVGTGRLAIPLAARGVTVEGIEGSPAMIARLKAQPSGAAITVHQVDLADFTLPRADYAAAVCAVSTLFILTHDAQLTAIRAAARHLRPGGLLFIEAFRPDPTRFDRDGRRVESRPSPAGAHVVRSYHDPQRCSIRVTHELGAGEAAAQYEVMLHYAGVEQLDAMAADAGLDVVARWHDWTQVPAREKSTDPVSVYRK